ncbi:MAG TPA: DUF5694 domain-containing protein [Acidobacteriota bacterium]|nr:DUF5694 domain-containing protein [Acidobacteriota bacterium]
MKRAQLPVRICIIAGLVVLSAFLRELPAQDFGQRPELSPPQSRILLLGTFHFADAGLDDYKPQHSVDILSPRRQAEIEELIARLADFRPTKVALEWRPDRQEKVNRDYQDYLDGDFELSANEVHQIGFRLARKMDHSKVYLVDAPGRSYRPWVDPEQWAKENGQQHLLERAAPLWQQFERAARWEDGAKVQRSLRQSLLMLNDPERIRQAHGVYLIGSLAVGDGQHFPGADAKTRWFNRNLRIFANLMRITERPGERIFLIIGAGHLPILTHCVESSPEYELVPAARYLR